MKWFGRSLLRILLLLLNRVLGRRLDLVLRSGLRLGWRGMESRVLLWRLGVSLKAPRRFEVRRRRPFCETVDGPFRRLLPAHAVPRDLLPLFF